MRKQDKQTLREFSILTEEESWNKTLLYVIEILRCNLSHDDEAVCEWLNSPGDYNNRSPRQIIAEGDVEAVKNLVDAWVYGVCS